MRVCGAAGTPVTLSLRLVSCVFWHTFLWLLRLEMVAAVENCTVVQMKCMQRLGCGMALQNYFLNCGELIHGETEHCSQRCKKALISLLSTEDQGGEAFMTCDCQGAQVCVRQRERLEVCSKQVMDVMKSINDDTTDIECTLAEWICNADTQCFTALHYYEIYCRKLIRGEKCTRRCNNSLSILYRQTKARKLRTCVCGGTEKYNCLELRTNIDQMCFGLSRESSTVKIRHPSQHDHTRAPPSLDNNKPHRPDLLDAGKNTSCPVDNDIYNVVGHSSSSGVSIQPSVISRRWMVSLIVLYVTFVGSRCGDWPLLLLLLLLHVL